VKRAVLLLACAALLGGCGKRAYDGPTISRALAQRLLAALDTPAALQSQTIRAINAHRIPAALQEPLLSRVNALRADPSTARRTELEDWLRRVERPGSR
jgi:hypothetical protein